MNGAPGIATKSDRTLRTGLLAVLLVTRSADMNSLRACGITVPVIQEKLGASCAEPGCLSPSGVANLRLDTTKQ